MPFDAMKGLQEAIREREERHARVERHGISEEEQEALSAVLNRLSKGDKIRISYYCHFHDVEKTGTVTAINYALVTAGGDFLKSTTATEDGKLVLSVEAGEGYVLPETFTVTIDGVDYTVNTSCDNVDGITFDSDSGELTISTELLSSGGELTITLNAVESEPEPEPEPEPAAEPVLEQQETEPDIEAAA